MDSLLRLADRFDRPVLLMGRIAGLVVLPLIAVIMFDVITRKIDFIRIGMADMNLRWFNPIIFQDLEWHLHGIVLFLSFGFGYLMNAHVRVDIFRERLSQRNQARLELWALLFLALPYLLLITYFAYQFVEMSFLQGEGSESLTGIDMRYIIKSSMVIGFVILILSFLATIFRLIVYLWGNVEQQRRAHGAIQIFSDDHEFDAQREELIEHLHEEEEKLHPDA